MANNPYDQYNGRDLEQEAWDRISLDDYKYLDKLYLAKLMGYTCGPMGFPVPKKDKYIVRPVINPMGLGLGTLTMEMEGDTDKYCVTGNTNLYIGYFWCEFFKGRHISVDYHYGQQVLAVEGFKSGSTFMLWNKWQKVDVHIPLPPQLEGLAKRHPILNVEYVDGNPIEVHFRENVDFCIPGMEEFIPVFEKYKDDKDPIPNKPGYTYYEYPDIHGRRGAWVK